MDGALFEYRQGQEVFFFSKNIQTGPGARTASYSTGTTVLSGNEKAKV
jgi:hypothetical protein